MTTRLKTLLMLAGFTIVCASCASNCGEEEHKPQQVNLQGRAAGGSTSMTMTRPRAMMAKEAAEDAAIDAH